MYKMVDITKEARKNNTIEVIVDSVNILWLNEKNIEEQLGHKDLPSITNKYDEQTVISSIKDAFEGEDMQSQYSLLGCRIDLYFHKYKLAIEVD